MTISIDIPDVAGVDEHYLKEVIAASLYYTGKLSEKQARDLLNMTRRAFEEMLTRYGYSIMVDSENNLDIEVKA